jgi:hypothetical protein
VSTSSYSLREETSLSTTNTMMAKSTTQNQGPRNQRFTFPCPERVLRASYPSLTTSDSIVTHQHK